MRAYTPPRRFAGYEVRELLGKGGMASVFSGEHVLLQRAVAIKFLHHNLAASETGQQRFLREARLVAKLSHPNIVTVFDFGQLDDGTYYQASELVAGTTLREHLKSGALPAARALGFARQLALGLASAHAAGVIHRDLKPSNVMLVPDPQLADGYRIKLLDFGIAKSLEVDADITAITKTGVSIGTPGYMSPEQCRGSSELGPASDVYSLGVVLYVMLCGAPPFAGENLMELHVKAPPPRPSERCGCAPAIDELVLWCLAKSPVERPAAMSEVIAAIDRILADPAAVAHAQGTPGALVALVASAAPPALMPVPAQPPSASAAADDGPRTLALPVDPVSGAGDASTTTVARAPSPAPEAQNLAPSISSLAPTVQRLAPPMQSIARLPAPPVQHLAPPAPSPAPSRRARWLAGALAAGVLVIGVLAAAWPRSSSSDAPPPAIDPAGSAAGSPAVPPPTASVTTAAPPLEPTPVDKPRIEPSDAPTATDPAARLDDRTAEGAKAPVRVTPSSKQPKSHGRGKPAPAPAPAPTPATTSEPPAPPKPRRDDRSFERPVL